MNRYQSLHSALFFLLINLSFYLLFFFSSLYSGINSDGDIEYWQYLSYEKHFSKKQGISLAAELRTANDVSKPYLTYLQGLYIFSPTPYFSFRPGYRQQIARSDVRSWSPFYSPMADIIFNGSLNRFNWEDRSRTQFVIEPDRNR